MFSALNAQDEICLICGWQNDLVDLQAMYQPMGPNKVSLEEAQKIFAEKGPRKSRFRSLQPPPLETFKRDPKWRPLDRTKDTPQQIDPDATNPEDIYYWYWHNQV
jgi:hypothetical protein